MILAACGGRGNGEKDAEVLATAESGEGSGRWGGWTGRRGDGEGETGRGNLEWGIGEGEIWGGAEIWRIDVKSPNDECGLGVLASNIILDE